MARPAGNLTPLPAQAITCMQMGRWRASSSDGRLELTSGRREVYDGAKSLDEFDRVEH